MTEGRLTEQQILELELYNQAENIPLLEQLLREFREQGKALATLRQYVQMFSDADGTAADVDALVSDFRDVLDGVGSAGTTKLGVL